MKLFKMSVVFSLLIISGILSAASYQEGKDYKVLAKPGIPLTPGKIEVREFFWYGCSHCYNLELKLGPWKKTLAKDVEFVAVPATAAPHWKVLASAHYAAKNLGILKQAHPAIFKEIHLNKNPLRTPKQVAKFLSQFGVTEQDVLDNMESFSTKTAMRQAENLFRQYQLTSVPSLIVHGKYYVTSPSFDEALRIVDYLIEKERKASLGAEK